MVTILERTYPDTVIADIVGNHLKVDDVTDELYQQAVQCVKNAFDVAEDFTNRRMIDTLATIGYTDVSELMELPTSPIKEVVEVRYLGADNMWRTIPEDGYVVESNGQRATIELLVVPALSQSRRGCRFEVSVRCGYDAEGEYALPGSIYQGIALMAGTFFTYQGDTVVGSVAELPLSSRVLLTPYRIHPYEY